MEVAVNIFGAGKGNWIEWWIGCWLEKATGLNGGLAVDVRDRRLEEMTRRNKQNWEWKVVKI